MKFKSIDLFDEKQKEAAYAVLDPEFNKYKTETAGFIPLEVKMKQFEQNGMAAQFLVSEFTSTDYRNMYLNPDFDITPEDDMEDVEEKLNALRAYQEEYKKAKSAGSNEPPTAAKAGTEEPEKEPEKAEN